MATERFFCDGSLNSVNYKHSYGRAASVLFTAQCKFEDYWLPLLNILLRKRPFGRLIKIINTE